MTVSRGFYRHYKSHVYFVHGVACLKHEDDRRVVIYTSVLTEEGSEGFDFLARDEDEFEQWVCPGSRYKDPMAPPLDREFWRKQGYEPRFERITDPEKSVVPR